jgi:acetyltransferase-like isoleucine patch superfamily enzyme
MVLKKIIKQILLRIRLRNVNFKNLHDWTHIGKYTIIQTDKTSFISFNNRVSINNYVSISAMDNAQIILGERVFVGDYSSIQANRANISIGSNTMIAQNVNLISTNHFYKDKDKLIHDQDIDLIKIGINIGSDCWLGAACTILPGVNVGNGVVIGANSVVTKNIPDYAIIVGNPASIIGYRE